MGCSCFKPKKTKRFAFVSENSEWESSDGFNSDNKTKTRRKASRRSSHVRNSSANVSSSKKLIKNLKIKIGNDQFYRQLIMQQQKGNLSSKAISTSSNTTPTSRINGNHKNVQYVTGFVDPATGGHYAYFSTNQPIQNSVSLSMPVDEHHFVHVPSTASSYSPFVVQPGFHFTNDTFIHSTAQPMQLLPPPPPSIAMPSEHFLGSSVNSSISHIPETSSSISSITYSPSNGESPSESLDQLKQNYAKLNAAFEETLRLLEVSRSTSYTGQPESSINTDVLPQLQNRYQSISANMDMLASPSSLLGSSTSESNHRASPSVEEMNRILTQFLSDLLQLQEHHRQQLENSISSQ